MKGKLAIPAVLSLLLLILFLSGCGGFTDRPYCGNLTCEKGNGEDNKNSPNYCPLDCGVAQQQPAKTGIGTQGLDPKMAVNEIPGRAADSATGRLPQDNADSTRSENRVLEQGAELPPEPLTPPDSAPYSGRPVFTQKANDPETGAEFMQKYKQARAGGFSSLLVSGNGVVESPQGVPVGVNVLKVDEYIVQLEGAPLYSGAAATFSRDNSAAQGNVVALFESPSASPSPSPGPTPSTGPQNVSLPERQPLASREQELVAKQEAAISRMNELLGREVVKRRFHKVFYGFSIAKVSEQDLLVIKGMKGVREIYENRTYLPTLMDSVQSIGADSAWQAQSVSPGKHVNGEGMRIGIIDTGIDYTLPSLGGCFGQKNATTEFKAWFVLSSEDGGLVGLQFARIGDNLVELFKDSENNKVLKTEIIVKAIGKSPAFVDYVEITRDQSSTGETYTKGKKITGLEGTGKYKGRSMVLELKQIESKQIKEPQGETCKVEGGYDFEEDDADPMDEQGHGTHVAGITAANGKLLGVAPEAKLYAIKVLGVLGGSADGVIAGMEYAADPDSNPLTNDRLDVVNMSLGAYCWGEYTKDCGPDDPVSQAADTLSDAGVAVVVAAGNAGPDDSTVGSPGTARKVITVGAVYKKAYAKTPWETSVRKDQPTVFSSRGPVDWVDEKGVRQHLDKPDVVAPGAIICSPGRFMVIFFAGDVSERLRCIDREHIAISGTSMASPMVAGAATLVRQANPQLTPQQVKERLMATATNLGLAKKVQGSGKVDVQKAIGRTSSFSVAPGIIYGEISPLEASATKSFTLRVDNHTGSRITLKAHAPEVGGLQVSVTPTDFYVKENESVEIKVNVAMQSDKFNSGDMISFIVMLVGGNGQNAEIPFRVLVGERLEVSEPVLDLGLDKPQNKGWKSSARVMVKNLSKFETMNFRPTFAMDSIIVNAPIVGWASFPFSSFPQIQPEGIKSIFSGPIRLEPGQSSALMVNLEVPDNEALAWNGIYTGKITLDSGTQKLIIPVRFTKYNRLRVSYAGMREGMAMIPRGIALVGDSGNGLLYSIDEEKREMVFLADKPGNYELWAAVERKKGGEEAPDLEKDRETGIILAQGIGVDGESGYTIAPGEPRNKVAVKLVNENNAEITNPDYFTLSVGRRDSAGNLGMGFLIDSPPKIMYLSDLPQDFFIDLYALARGGQSLYYAAAHREGVLTSDAEVVNPSSFSDVAIRIGENQFKDKKFYLALIYNIYGCTSREVFGCKKLVGMPGYRSMRPPLNIKMMVNETPIGKNTMPTFNLLFSNTESRESPFSGGHSVTSPELNPSQNGIDVLLENTKITIEKTVTDYGQWFGGVVERVKPVYRYEKEKISSGQKAIQVDYRPYIWMMKFSNTPTLLTLQRGEAGSLDSIDSGFNAVYTSPGIGGGNPLDFTSNATRTNEFIPKYKLFEDGQQLPFGRDAAYSSGRYKATTPNKGYTLTGEFKYSIDSHLLSSIGKATWRTDADRGDYDPPYFRSLGVHVNGVPYQRFIKRFNNQLRFSLGDNDPDLTVQVSLSPDSAEQVSSGSSGLVEARSVKATREGDEYVAAIPNDFLAWKDLASVKITATDGAGNTLEFVFDESIGGLDAPERVGRPQISPS